MSDVKVIFGSTTGCTEAAANIIAANFGTTAINVANAAPADFQADLLILGTSTWGVGDLQDDWFAGVQMLDGIDLKGKKAAVFAMGDQCEFADSYVDSMRTLADKLEERGAALIGKPPSAGYPHTAPPADQDGFFCGLALDDTNEPDKTADRIAKWCDQLRAEMK